MKEDMEQDKPVYSKELAEEITKAINDHGTDDFSEAKNWWTKTGLKAEEAEKKLVKKLVDILSQYLSDGLLQLTIEEVMNEKEYKDAVQRKKNHAIVAHLEKKLPTFNAYVEFIIRSGLMEIAKIRYDFEAEPEVEVEDIKLNIQGYKIKSVSFGTFIASISLYLLKGDLHVKISSIERKLSLPRTITL